MSIQKKSLISALKTTKKANVASAEVAKGEKLTSMRPAHAVVNAKNLINPRSVVSAKKNFISGKKMIEPKRFTNMKKTVE
jgi:hypothetical protein